MKLFEQFDKVYLINLKKREDRLNLFKKEVEKYNLGTFILFEAIDGSQFRTKINSKLLDGEVGVIQSNLEILKDAKNKNYNKILIIEDDCYFTEEIKNIDSYFIKLPDNWDMLYFGGNHNTHVGSEPPKVINDKVVKLHYTFAAHMVAIKSHMYDEIINKLSNFNKQLDVVYTQVQKTHNVYSFYPAIAKQRESFSDIQNKVVNYDWLIK